MGATGIAALGRITHLLVNAIHHISTLHTGHTHAHEAHHSTTLVAGSILHSSTGCTSQEGSSCIGVGQCLQIANVFFVFFAGFNAAYAEGYYFNAAQIAPFLAQYFVELVANFFSMSRQSAVTHALFAHNTKGNVESSQELAFQLAINFAAQIFVFHVTAHIGVEENRVSNFIAVFTKAANRNVHVQTNALVHYTELDGASGAILITNDFLGIEVVHTLVLARVAAIGKAFTDLCENILDALHIQAISKKRWLGRSVIHKFTGLGANFYNLAVFYNNHTLTIINGNGGAIANDVVFRAGIGTATPAGDALHALGHQYIGLQAFAVDKLLPLVAQNAAHGAHACFN